MSAGPVSATALANDGTTELDHGRIALIDNQIDQATGTARIKAEFPNQRNVLWPGEFVNARIEVRQQNNALTVPSAAVQRSGDGLFVYVVKPDSTVEARPVKVGVDTGEFALIDSGVQAGEQVVVAGQYRLQPGARIRANDPPGHPSATADGKTAAQSAS